MTPILARSATAAQATFEPDEEDEDGEDDFDEEDGELLTFSPVFLSPVPDFSVDDEEDEESELTVLSDFLPSDPFDAAAAAGSALFWLERLSLR
jgi:hypothetical protein